MENSGGINPIGLVMPEIFTGVGGKVLFGVLMDIVEALIAGTPILVGIILGLPESFLTAMLTGELGLLDSAAVGLGINFIVKGIARHVEENEDETNTAEYYAMEIWLAEHVAPEDRTYAHGQISPRADIGIGISLGALGVARVPSSVFEYIKRGATDYLEDAPEVVL